MVLELVTSGQAPRVQNYLYHTIYQRVEKDLLSLQVMKVQRIIKGVHNVSSEFC